MGKSIAVIGTLDTKGNEIKYIKDLIENRNHRAVVIDVGILGNPPFDPSISHEEVVGAIGLSLEEVIALNSEAEAMIKMAAGTAKIVADMYSNDQLDGVLVLGGTMGTSLALTVMGVLPVGVPKLILTTIAFSPLIRIDTIKGDLMMMQWVAGLRGINTINRKVLDTAAGAIIGAAETFDKQRIVEKKKTIGITSLGSVPSRYMSWLQPALEEKGYEVAAFHATGMGGRMFEQCIRDGLIDMALDLELTELANEKYGGLTSAGKHRLEAAGEKGIPQIVAPTVHTVMWSPDLPTPSRFKGRPTRKHNWLCSNFPTTTEEKAEMAAEIAEKLNKATGPVAVIIPLRGRYPQTRKKGRGIVDDAAGSLAILDCLKRQLKPEVRVVEVDSAINEQTYTDKILELVDEMMERT